VLSEHHPSMHEMAHEFEGPLEMALSSFTSLPFALALLGVITAYYFYLVNLRVPQWFSEKFAFLKQILENKYYLDWFNEHVSAALARALGRVFWRIGDLKIIDGFIVNGSWRLVSKLSTWVRPAQTGYLYHYALVMIVGVFFLMTWFVWLKP